MTKFTNYNFIKQETIILIYDYVFYATTYIVLLSICIISILFYSTIPMFLNIEVLGVSQNRLDFSKTLICQYNIIF